MARRLYHKGTLTAEAGTLCWAIAVGIGFLRGQGWVVSEFWVVMAFLSLGLLLIMFGIRWEMTADIRTVSVPALTHLHWLARFCPRAAELLEREPIPVWRDAFLVDAACRKRGRDDDAPRH
ncbi:MAG: hypothetical protein ACYCUY_00115 [Acidithiobacillus sp.]